MIPRRPRRSPYRVPASPEGAPPGDAPRAGDLAPLAAVALLGVARAAWVTWRAEPWDALTGALALAAWFALRELVAASRRAG